MGFDFNPISAVASLAGDYLAADQARKAGNKDRAAMADANAQNIAMQREFAQNGIQWRVADAVKAGLSPLAALGSSGASFSSQVMPLPTNGKYQARANMYQNMGQNIARALGSTMTQKERMIKDASDDLTLKEIAYKNKLLDYQASNIGKTDNPPFPDGMGRTSTGLPGQESQKMQLIPTGRTYGSIKDPSQAYGSITDWYYRATPSGLKVAPSPDVQGVLANNAVEMLRWEARHKVGELTNPSQYEPSRKEFPLPKGWHWRWNPLAQEYQPYSNESDVLPRPWHYKSMREMYNQLRAEK